MFETNQNMSERVQRLIVSLFMIPGVFLLDYSFYGMIFKFRGIYIVI